MGGLKSKLLDKLLGTDSSTVFVFYDAREENRGKIFFLALSVSARSSTYTHIIARSIVIVSLLGCGMIFITWFIVVLEAQSR